MKYPFSTIWFVAVLLNFFLIGCLHAQKPEFYSKNGQALQGYDVVAYHTENEAIKGNESFSYEWKDATWLFKSKDNLEMFMKQPDKYAPKYGGYCAYAVANGYTAKTEPDAFDIVDGQLYLNYNKKVQEKWRADREDYIEAGNNHWPEVLKE